MNEQEKSSREEAYVQYIINRCQQDNGTAAKMRRADNPDTEYQSWEILAGFNIDLDKPWERLPYAVVGAAIAKSKIEQNGTVGLGRAIANCYDEGSKSDQAKAKLRRLLACRSSEEVARIVRPLLTLISSKTTLTLNYTELLKQLRGFYWQSNRVREQWAADFYRHGAVTHEPPHEQSEVTA